MEPLFASCLFIIIVSCLAGIMDIVRARTKKGENSLFFSGFSFLLGVFVAALLLNHFLLSLVVLGVLGLMGFFLLPKSFGLHKQELITHKQETDVLAPLIAKDFLNWKAWIKLKAIYGFRKMMIIYIISTTIVAAIAVTINYYQSWKILKEDYKK